MNNSLAILEALLLKQPSAPAIDYIDGVVKTTSPLTVRCTGEDTDSPAEPVGRPMVANERVAVITIGKRRLAIPYGLASDPTLVPWTIPGRHVTIGPDGDQQPALELIRDRPTGRHSALMYLALGATPELAWLLRDGDTALATLRLTKDGLRLQNNVTGVTRYFAFDDDTGWQPLTLAAGFTGTCYYRVKNGYVSYKGRVTRTAGPWPNAYTTITATMPAAAQSPDTFYGMGVSRYSPLPYAIGSTISITSGGAASPNSEFELRSIAPFTP